jgi:hypothetical protein
MSGPAYDATDAAIEALVKCREAGMSRAALFGVVRDVYAAPWSSPPKVKIYAVAPPYVAARARREPDVSAKQDFEP